MMDKHRVALMASEKLCRESGVFLRSVQMKRLVVFVLAAGLCVGTVFAQDAASIMQAAKDRIQADTVSRRSRMVITAKNGTTTERVVDQY